MCHVLKNNFEEVFPAIEKCIEEALFIAIDSEFTGLTVDEEEKSSLFDSGAERYSKLRKNASQVTICQIGLSTFSRSSVSQRTYDAHTFNFYIFPSTFGSISTSFWCQASSLKFLFKHGFDFNTFVSEGVPYMNEVQEKQLQQEFEQGSLFSGLDRGIDENLLQESLSEVAKWSATSAVGERLTLQCSDDVPRYVLLSELQVRYPGLAIFPSDSDKVTVEKTPPDQGETGAGDRRKEVCNKVKKEEEMKIMNSMLGFTRVIRLLKKHKKPLVGHNMFMDLMLIYDKFHKPLPAKYEQFKADIHSIFPCIYDTKNIVSNVRKPLAETGLVHSTSLSGLYEQLSSKKGLFTVLYSPTIRHAEGFNRYDDIHHPHEAGYDAFMAGTVFIRLAHLALLYGVQSSKVRPPEFHDYLRLLAPYKNNVNLIRASIDYMSFQGSDPVSRRPQWLVVSSKLSSWKLNSMEVASQFSAYGSVDIRLQSSRQGLVAVGNNRCAKDILKAFKNHKYLSVSKYSLLKHSPVIRGLLWSGLAISGGLLLCVIFSQDKMSS